MVNGSDQIFSQTYRELCNQSLKQDLKENTPQPLALGLLQI